MEEEQKHVEQFIEEHDLTTKPTFRILDLLTEVGEIASDATESSAYGENEEALRVGRDEIGDALFSLLALASRLDVDAKSALGAALEKYETRLADTGTASSEGGRPPSDVQE